MSFYYSILEQFALLNDSFRVFQIFRNHFH